MNTATALLAGLALIAAAIFFGNGAPARGETDPGDFGPWNFKTAKPDFGVWKLNSATGEFHFCTSKQCTKLVSH